MRSRPSITAPWRRSTGGGHPPARTARLDDRRTASGRRLLFRGLRPARCGSAPGRRRGPRGRPARAGPCRSSACPRPPTRGTTASQLPQNSRGDPGVRRVLQHRAELAVVDLPGDLRAELEVQPLVVDAPAPVRLHVDAVGRCRRSGPRAPVAGLQVDVRHTDQRDTVPAVGAHRAVADSPELGRRLAAR